ncbi:MAG: hypothetical protein M1812_001519 [Candelaria pacifica]|nr:MAG: hypothetical protein M1812_001519 [Candelaria pacifica]
MGDSIVKYTFSSVYKFSRRGAQEIEASFSSTGPGRFAHCNYDQSRDTFKIECGRDSEEETIFSFLDIFTRYIDAETLDASVSRFNGILSTLVFLKARTNVQGALKVERVEATSLERPSLGWGTLEDSSEGSNDINEEPGEEVPCSTVWTPKSVQTGFLSKLSQWSIDSIEELTSCVLQVDADRTTIRISGSPTTAVDKALKKLDTLERKHYQEFQTTEFHLVEPEKEQGFALQFLSLRKAGNQMLRSTLLRLDSPQISELHKRVVVRTLVYDESRRVWLPLKKKIESITAADGASQSFGIWEYFRFRSLGIDSDVFGHLAAHNTDFSSLFSSEDGGLGNENLPPAKAEQVRAWQRQVQNDNLEELAELPPTPSVLSTVKSSTSGKGEESSVMEELIDKLDPQATTASQHGSPPAIEELSPKKRMGKFRRPKVLGAAGVPGSEQEYGSLDQPVTPDQVSTYGNGPILGTAVSPNSAPEHNESHTAYQSAENIQSLEATKGQSGSNQEDLRVLMQQDVAPSLVLDSLRSPSKRNQPLVTPREETSVQPQTPEVLLDLSEPFMAHSNLPQAPSSDFEFPVTSETRALKAISLLDSVENPESFRYMPHLPALAPSASTPDLASMKVSELSSSRESDRLPQSQLGAVNDVLVGSDVAAQETSNDGGLAKDVTSAISIGSANSQKAARRKGRVDTARLKKLNEMGTSMLERARPFNGDIRLAVEIGRILLSGVSPQYTTSPFAETEWDNAFTGRGGSAIPRTTFTNM